MRSVYLDYNATTPLDPAVREAMLPFLGEVWGNPSSLHRIGRQARFFLDEAHERVAAVLGCKPSEVTFTSGGTESVNLAILGAARRLKSKGRHLITSAIEHPSALRTFDHLAKAEGFDVTVLPVDRAGLLSVESLQEAIRADTILVSIMAANNEVGTLQPVSAIGNFCRERGILFHTDAVQWFGKEPFADVHQFQADLVSICCHKFHGPKGAGVLFVKSPFQLESISFGGSQENERRPGTENLAAIAGFVEALEHFVKVPVFSQKLIAPLTESLIRSFAEIRGVHFVGSLDSRLFNTASFVVEGTDSASLLAALDLEGFCASSGSACSSGSTTPSKVALALGYPAALASALIRFSLGRESTAEDMASLTRNFPALVARSQLVQ